MTALGVLRALHAHGLRVPADISVVGFDDLFIASYTDPPLTTVRQPRRRMGLLAMESLLQLMGGQNPSQAITVAAELVIRESSAPPRKARK
jgi:DNA-binding LacI/PurR family transcriptional regulator